MLLGFIFDIVTATVFSRVFFFNFIAVFSNLLLSQSLMFTFCASNSPLHPATGEGEWNRNEPVACSLECVSRNTKLGNAIPKPQHQ